MVKRKIEDLASWRDEIGVDSRTHRTITIPDCTGTPRRWHYLDNADLLAARGIDHVHGTLLCVHGNPTSSFLFRSLVNADIPWRVIAVDQLEMGYSERTDKIRHYRDRVADLRIFTAQLNLPGKIITVGHDWGGLISLGWAVASKDRLAGVILTNTAIFQKLEEKVPPSLQLATAPGMLPLSTSRTSAFLETTLALSDPPLSQEIKAGYRNPYRTVNRRRGIEDFVADIPASGDHPSRSYLEEVAAEVTQLNVPTLMVWGPRDVVFKDRYLKDLIARIPHADVHRVETASHLVWEDADTAGIVSRWLEENFDENAQPLDNPRPRISDLAKPAPEMHLGEKIEQLAADEDYAQRSAVVEMGKKGTRPREITWSLLNTRIREIAAGLLSQGVGPGKRVVVLVPPGADLTAALYACLRIGAVVVLADAGLGVKGLTRAVIGSHADYLIGIDKALLAARTLGWPGERISVRALPKIDQIALGCKLSLPEIALEGRNLLALDDSVLGDWPAQDADAAVLFTSGSTGPAKGAVYTHAQLSAMFDVVGATLGMDPERGLVAGFAPFALLGPALGAPSVVPDMDVTAPATLTASALAEAVATLDEPAVFTAPAALMNLVATQDELTAAQRETLASVPSFFSAGAPIPPALLDRLLEVLPNARAMTPYGMTECLAVTAIDREEIRAAGEGNGVCVGKPLPQVDVMIAPLQDNGETATELTDQADIVGEVLIRAAHARDRYLMLWDTTRHAERYAGWHATGDVGHFDEEHRLWIEGRLAHVMYTADGVITPVVVEAAAETVERVRRAGACAVGPIGTQQLVVFAEIGDGSRPKKVAIPEAAESKLAEEVRRSVFASTGIPVAQVYQTQALPTDIRHNSKIDRSALAAWAEKTLRGEKAGRP